jgi:multiple sugar transport system permease protein
MWRLEKWVPYFFLAPAGVYLLAFQGVPILQELRLSLTATSLVDPTGGSWVGLRNYYQIFSSEDFQQTLVNTVIYVIVCVVGAVGIGLIAALLLNGSFFGHAVARALIAVPWAVPGIAVALVATWMTNSQYGVVNRLLDAVGLGVPGGQILNSTTYAMPAILITTVWTLFPFCAIVLLSALQSVSAEVREAALVDGAGAWWVYRVAIWPVIRPTVGLLALLMTIWSIRRFELIWLMTQGGPAGSTKTLVIDLYSRAFQSNDLGTAAAVGMVGVAISLAVVMVSQILTKRSEGRVG